MSNFGHTEDSAGERCKQTVYIRDQYRRTGRGKSGFEMHYITRQCKKIAVNGTLCQQHRNMLDRIGLTG